jgi:FixJ family two-component response regulator
MTRVDESSADFLASDDMPRTACLIVDVRMPEMSGPELFSYLMASCTPIPTVLISACADERTRARALKNRVRCYLAKPLMPEEFLACIRSAIEDGDGKVE